MLGEKHSLDNDFPQYKELIAKLSSSDEAFAKKSKHYHQLDKEIRVLELNNAPIDDTAMHQLKHERAMLKDELYQQLVSADS